MPGLYQHLLTGAASYQELGSRVLRQIEGANAFRQTEKVKELARILAHIPIKEYQLAAQYHLVLCKCRESEYQSEVLERIAEQSRTYRAKALISRAAFDVYQGNAEGALNFYAEALRVSPTISDFIKASTGIATVKSAEGFNNSALKDLERLIPVLRYADWLTLFLTLNSYAVELSETGRLYEAQNVLSKATASSLAPFYPELGDTLSDVRSRRTQRSTVTITRKESQPEIEAESSVLDNLLHKAKVQAVIDFMNANIDRNIAMTDVASLVNFSDTYLSRVFKIETGITPSQYLARLRMEKASHLLKTTFLSIKQIMAAVGYNSKSYFSKHFKRHFGVTPSEHRLAKLRKG